MLLHEVARFDSLLLTAFLSVVVCANLWCVCPAGEALPHVAGGSRSAAAARQQLMALISSWVGHVISAHIVSPYEHMVGWVSKLVAGFRIMQQLIGITTLG
jgi:hypothetical protein